MDRVLTMMIVITEDDGCVWWVMGQIMVGGADSGGDSS